MDSLLLTDNTTSSTLAAGNTIPLGSAVHGKGCAIKMLGDAIKVRGKGYFEILIVVGANITAQAAATVSLLQDGAVVSAVTLTPSAAGESETFVIPWVVRNGCECAEHTLSLQTSAAMTLTKVTTVTKGGV